MKLSYLALVVILVASLESVAQQKVYKTTDAEGNSVFTDVPPKEGAEIVPLQSPNIAESVEVRPLPEPAAESRPAAKPQPQGEPTTYHGGNDDLREDLYEERRKRELHDRAREADGPPEQPPSTQPPARLAPSKRRPAGPR